MEIENNNFTLIHLKIESHACSSPSDIAIVDAGQQISYASFVDSFRRLATAIKSLVSGRNARVGVFIDNSAEAYIAMLGTMRGDCCYVPLGVSLPPKRLAEIMRISEMEVVVTVAKQLPSLKQALSIYPGLQAVIILDADAGSTDGDFDLDGAAHVLHCSDVAQSSPDPGQSQNIGEDLAYIIFTSGTTGQPKGVAISHASLRDFVNWSVHYLQLTPRDRVSNHPRINFDLSIIDIFGCLAAGATLCPVTHPGDLFLPGSFIRNRKISVWVSVPSVLATMKKGRQLKPGAFDGVLRSAVFCGEALPPDLAKSLQAACTGLEIHNLYGPTEATCACSYHFVDCDSLLPNQPVPIGRANENTEMFLLQKDADALAGIGEVGRLMICGSQLAHGYWRNDEMTTKAFRPNPFKPGIPSRMYDTGDLARIDADGIFHYVGRRDLQVKLQGYRIELGEIEMTVRSHSQVVDAGVCVLEADGRPSEIVVAVVPGHGGDDREALCAAIRSLCREQLPVYMVPRYVFVLDAIPKNPNGKNDRKQLQTLVQERMLERSEERPHVRGDR